MTAHSIPKGADRKCRKARVDPLAGVATGPAEYRVSESIVMCVAAWKGTRTRTGEGSELIAGLTSGVIMQRVNRLDFLQ